MSARAMCFTAVPACGVARPSTKRASVQRSNQPTRSVAAQVSAMEVMQVAGEASFISGTAGTMIAMTLIGLSLGFVLLRVESLVEEGKIL